MLSNHTCISAFWTLGFGDGHWTMFPSGSQSAQWTTVRPAGWTTQLPHPRSGEQKDGFAILCYISSYTSRFRYIFLHTSHEDLRSHGATCQARAVSSIRVEGDRRNCRDKVRGGGVKLFTWGLQTLLCFRFHVPAASLAMWAMLLKELFHCSLTESSQPAGSCGSTCKLRERRRLFLMDCKDSPWHLIITWHLYYSHIYVASLHSILTKPNNEKDSIPMTEPVRKGLSVYHDM